MHLSASPSVFLCLPKRHAVPYATRGVQAQGKSELSKMLRHVDPIELIEVGRSLVPRPWKRNATDTAVTA